MLAATAALAFFTFVATSKVMLNKYVFVDELIADTLSGSLAFAEFTCAATIIVLLPVFACTPALFTDVRTSLDRPHAMRKFVCILLATASDLLFTFYAISQLSVALQQTIKSTSPAATMITEIVVTRRFPHRVVALLVTLLVAGNVLAWYGSDEVLCLCP
jgi:drug/metabolite transporter (DMT)-like permease